MPRATFHAASLPAINWMIAPLAIYYAQFNRIAYRQSVLLIRSRSIPARSLSRAREASSRARKPITRLVISGSPRDVREQLFRAGIASRNLLAAPRTFLYYTYLTEWMTTSSSFVIFFSRTIWKSWVETVVESRSRVDLTISWELSIRGEFRIYKSKHDPIDRKSIV